MSLQYSPLTAEICWRVWGTPTNFNGFRVFLLHGTLVVGISQTLRRWTEGTTYIQQGGHHVGHWPTFLICVIVYLCMFAFVVLHLVSLVLCQEIGYEERLRDKLFCVEWDIKPSLNQSASVVHEHISNWSLSLWAHSENIYLLISVPSGVQFVIF